MFRYIITMLMLLGVSSSVFAATSTYDRFVGNHAKFKNVSSVSGQFSGTVYAADAVFKGPSIDSRAYSTLALADAAATSAGKQLVISTVYTTVPATLSAPAVKILPGGKLNGSGSVVITGQFEGSDGCFGTNQAVTGLKEARPEWWTVNADPGTTNMAAAIQKANDTIVSTGKGVMKLSGTYACNSMLTLNVTAVEVRGVNAKLDFSGLAGDTAILITGSAIGAPYYQSAGGISGVEVAGPGKATATTGIQFTSVAESGPSHSQYQKINIHGFGVGVSFEKNAYIINFYSSDFWNNGTCLKMATGFTNYGERISFNGCTFFNSDLAVYNNNPSGAFHFTDCSFDYNSPTCQGAYFWGIAISKRPATQHPPL